MTSQMPADAKKIMDMAMSEKNVMIHLEFEFGNMERPHTCIKFPVSKEAAIVAMLLSINEGCDSDKM